MGSPDPDPLSDSAPRTTDGEVMHATMTDVPFDTTPTSPKKKKRKKPTLLSCGCSMSCASSAGASHAVVLHAQRVSVRPRVQFGRVNGRATRRLPTQVQQAGEMAVTLLCRESPGGRSKLPCSSLPAGYTDTDAIAFASKLTYVCP